MERRILKMKHILNMLRFIHAEWPVIAGLKGLHATLWKQWCIMASLKRNSYNFFICLVQIFLILFNPSGIEVFRLDLLLIHAALGKVTQSKNWIFSVTQTFANWEADVNTARDMKRFFFLLSVGQTSTNKNLKIYHIKLYWLLGHIVKIYSSLENNNFWIVSSCWD